MAHPKNHRQNHGEVDDYFNYFYVQNREYHLIISDFFQHTALSPHTSVLSVLDFSRLLLIGDVNQSMPKLTSSSVKSQSGVNSRLSLFSRVVNGIGSGGGQGVHDPLRFHRLSLGMRFENPLLLQLQLKLLGIVGSPFAQAEAARRQIAPSSSFHSSSFAPFYVFRLPTDPPSDFLAQDPWSACWTKITNLEIRGLVCGVALLLRTLRNYETSQKRNCASKINIIVASQDEELRDALARDHKIIPNVSVINSAADILVQIFMTGCT